MLSVLYFVFMDSYFKKFAPKREQKRDIGKDNCVIYTRVSSLAQMENNGSLDIQYKECTNFAIRKGFKIIKYYGGDYESAKSDDERKHFSEMIQFVSNPDNKIKNIITYEYSRFSRTGLNALSVLNTLNQNNINVYAVIGGIEQPRSEMGMMMLSLNLMMARYENKQKSSLTIQRSRSKMLLGYWVHSCPKGYSRLKDKSKTIFINEDGKLIKMGFKMLLKGYSPVEMRQTLKRNGCTLPSSTFFEIFRNPFYCGIMMSNFLDYEPQEGIHPKLISIEDFKKVQKLFQVKKYPKGKRNEFSYMFPQRGIAKCSCGNRFTAYYHRKRNLGYYKCSKAGCSTNISQKRLDEHLYQKLGTQIPKEITQQECLSSFRELLKGLQSITEEDIKNLEKKIEEKKEKMMTLTDKMLDSELSEEIFTEKLNQENESIEKVRETIDSLKYEWSNIFKDSERVISFLKNSRSVFNKGDLLIQRRIQDVLYKSEQVYIKKTDQYLTPKRNKIIDLINCITESLGNKKSGQSRKNLDLSALVPEAGIEPAHLAIHEFESCASTSSATQAYLFFKGRQK